MVDMPQNPTKPNPIYLIYMYKKDLALNNLQWLICHKTQPNQIIYIPYISLKRILYYSHNQRHVRNRHIMFITIEHIKNLGISECVL